jgi:hypothetical protein
MAQVEQRTGKVDWWRTSDQERLWLAAAALDIGTKHAHAPDRSRRYWLFACPSIIEPSSRHAASQLPTQILLRRPTINGVAGPSYSKYICAILLLFALIMAGDWFADSQALRASPGTPHVDDPPTYAPAGFIAGALSAPHIVNLYWDVDWDSDVRAAGLDVAVLGKSALDGFVKGLTQSLYFEGLSEYGVKHVEFGGSALASPVCGTTAPVNIRRGVLAQFVTCMEASGKLPGHTTLSTVINILLPPSTTHTGSIFPAYHAYRCCPPKAPIPFTVVPLHAAQVWSALPVPNAFGAMMTHEMVEAITNPYGKYGWRDRHIEEGEIADFCPWRSGSASTGAMPFQLWSVTRYWSNRLNRCIAE